MDFDLTEELQILRSAMQRSEIITWSKLDLLAALA